MAKTFNDVEWREKNKEKKKKYNREYYLKSFEEAPNEPLRVCSWCGRAALSEDELEHFAKHSTSKHGYRNMCLSCITPKTPKVLQKVCKECKSVYEGSLEIEKHFRRTDATGSQVIGRLKDICKECEFPEELYYNIDGRYISKESPSKVY